MENHKTNEDLVDTSTNEVNDSLLKESKNDVKANKSINDLRKSDSRIKSFFKAYPIAILALIDTIMVLIPTYFENYIPNLNVYIHMSPSQYSQGLAFYGIFSIVANICGAYIGGKFQGKRLIVISLILQLVITFWYASLMFQGANITDTDKNYGVANYYQWTGILFLYALAISGLIWGPMWRMIKNYGTDGLEKAEREKKVATNNGIEGIYEGLIGLLIGTVGVVLYQLATKKIIPDVVLFNTHLSTAFLVLISMVFIFTISATILTLCCIKPEEKQSVNTGFTFKNLGSVIKNWKIWCMGMIIIAVFMLQMELAAYMNYLSNMFLVSPVIVIVAGLVRTYIMRFLVAGYVGKKADKAHSYIFWLLIGISIGIVFIVVAIFLPGIGGNNDISQMNHVTQIILQVAAIANLIVLGTITWMLVTIRWSPIGTELGITNDNYASAVAFLSALGFSPGLYYKWIKAAIESHHTDMSIIVNGESHLVVDKAGNQLVLMTCAIITFIGLIAGIILYINLYKNKDTFIFKRKNKNK